MRRNSHRIRIHSGGEAIRTTLALAFCYIYTGPFTVSFAGQSIDSTQYTFVEALFSNSQFCHESDLPKSLDRAGELGAAMHEGHIPSMQLCRLTEITTPYTAASASELDLHITFDRM